MQPSNLPTRSPMVFLDPATPVQNSFKLNYHLKVFTGPAHLNFTCSVWSFPAATSYTNLYNVLNFPAGVVPVSTVTRADEEELKHYRGHYEDPWDKRLKEVSRGSLSRRPWQYAPLAYCLFSILRWHLSPCISFTSCTVKRWHYTPCALTQHHA